MYLDYRKSLAVGGTVAVILGLGGTALATSGTDTVSGSSVHQTAAKPDSHGKKKHKQGLLGRAQHAQITTGGKKKTVTHVLWRGTVTAVSPTSLTVKSLDGKSQAYTVGKDTKYRERVKGKKPTASSLSKIAKGDRVIVNGTGTTKVTAKQVVELPKK